MLMYTRAIKIFSSQYDITKRQLCKNTLRFLSCKLNKNYKSLTALQSYSHTNERLEKPKTFNVKIQTRSGKFFRFTCCRGGNFN